VVINNENGSRGPDKNLGPFKSPLFRSGDVFAFKPSTALHYLPWLIVVLEW